MLALGALFKLKRTFDAVIVMVYAKIVRLILKQHMHARAIFPMRYMSTREPEGA